MVGPRIYDWMYRLWAPWDSVGVRKDLVDLVERGLVDPATHPRAIDLGCGTGANVVYLAHSGFDAHGVDFSEVAIGKARERVEQAGVRANLVVGDLTSGAIDGVEGTFDLVIDFGTMDDLRGEARKAMASTVERLSSPGTVFFQYCFYGRKADLPRFSLKGPSQLSHIAPGELESLFADEWDVTQLEHYEHWRSATFFLTRR